MARPREFASGPGASAPAPTAAYTTGSGTRAAGGAGGAIDVAFKWLVDWRGWAIPLAIVALAAALRLWAIKHDAANPFYDAAVRSMGLSWHNFFFGALDPNGALAIDKPPVDLWLQVVSTKLLGYNRTALALPEALGGIASVALLYAAVARVGGRLAGAIAAIALAVMPIAVLTARSDTMDSVMCALLVGALWAAIEGLRSRHGRWVLLSAALVGVAFNVKLTQALIPLPALAIMWCASAPARRRAVIAAGAAGVFVAIAMAWAFVASLTPLSRRPFPIGSHTGNIYKAIFVFNGVERLTGASHEIAPYATTSHPGFGRLLATAAPDYLKLIGLELTAAIVLLGFSGALWWREHREVHAALLHTTSPRAYAARWTTIALAVWMATGFVLFSFSGHLQPRYLEALAPAVAGSIGLGAAYLLRRRRPFASSALAVALLALVAVQAKESIGLIEQRTGDANPSGGGYQYGKYLRAHRAGARYEAAATNPLAVVGLIAQDGQPVLILRTIDGEMVSLGKLRRLVAERAVRYVLISSPCTSGRHCASTTSWSLRNSVQVHPGLYRYRLPDELR
ncbi:MAG TPA: glycosyltransferase family 39 protein [Solirubrobacteraceae bacterium]|jgi:4-amino-4-deoxy-L-arabinose transferase-like glycosyltransferase|nr:glycosyltransferase family 39 protein [Solirubrobacteraceae bacterium]